METKTRLLLPFTTGINSLALNYAIQMADQHQATLVPLALVPVVPTKGARLEHIQQAQDFLEYTRHKAAQRGVPLEPAQIYTGDVARSIEGFAGEMDCEAVILFLSNTEEILLHHREIRVLLERSSCNVHIMLFPEKPTRRSRNQLLHLPHLKRSIKKVASSQEEEPTLVIHRLLRFDDLQAQG